MIEITFGNSTNEVSAFGLTQWDKGQKLKINWQEMPETFQVHFASRDSSQAIVVQAKGGYGIAMVDIPDEMLKSSADINAWIYLTDGDDVGESVKRAVLYVRPRAKPQSFIEDLDMTQQDILENILGDIKGSITQLKEKGTDSEYVPSYLSQQVEKMLLKVSEYQSDDSFVFIAASDAHYKTGDSNSETGLKHMSQAMKLITESYPVDFAAYLGDMTSGGGSKDIAESKSEIMKVNSALFSSLHALPSFVCHGSEDYLLNSFHRNDGCINQTDIRNLITAQNKNIAEGSGNIERGYFFRDINDRKVRVICLNTSDTYGSDLTATSETALMSSEQLQWLCQSLDLSGKADAEKWGIVLLGYHPLDMIGKFSVAVRILESYVGGTAINVVTENGANIVYNFSGKNKAKILGQFHGHLHNYRVEFITGSNIPLVCIPNASFYNNNFYSNDSYTQEENLAYSEAVTYNKRVNTAHDTSFCVIVIDKESGKINAVHYGAGVDRTIEDTQVKEDSSSNVTDPGENPGGSGPSEDPEDYTGSYTNLVPTSTTVSGAIQAGKGYTENYKIGITGQITSSKGYVYTGYIKASFNDVMRCYGGTYDGSKGNYILAFDSNHKLLWVVCLTGNSDSSSGIFYYNSGVIEFYPSLVKTGNLDNIAYIRFSTIGKGTDLIVTRNERITSVAPGGPSDPIVNYVNILQFATDKNGNIYGNNGYAEGIKINFYNEEVIDDNYVVSGYLIADMKAVIRTKGLLFNGYSGSCLNLYDSNFNLIKCISLNTESDSENGITYDNHIVTFVPADANDDFSEMAYFRISGINKGDPFIITYCEEIA